jgi:hypothetical protein
MVMHYHAEVILKQISQRVAQLEARMAELEALMKKPIKSQAV